MSPIDAILGMLASSEGEVSAAAALVLGRLRPVEDRVVQALITALETAPSSTAPYIVDGLAATDRDEAIDAILPLLDERGSISEQAVRVLRQFGPRSLPGLLGAHEGRRGWRSGAWLKAVAGIGHIDAVRAVFERLGDCDWAEARASSIFLQENLGVYPDDARAFLIERVRAMLDRPAAAGGVHGIVTCLRLVRGLEIEVSPTRLLDFARDGNAPAVRRHALLAIEAAELDAAGRAAVLPGLVDLLFDRDEEHVMQPALELVIAWSDDGLDADTLVRLTESSWFAVVEFAAHELVDRFGDRAIAPVAPFLASRAPRLRLLAADVLTRAPGGAAVLIDAIAGSTPPPWRQEIAERVAKARIEWPAALIDELRRTYRDLCLHEHRYDRAVLDFLALSDRAGLSDWLFGEAQRLLDDGDADGAVRILQPLVRWRHATDLTRLLLARSNIAAADRASVTDPRFARGIELLASLSRTMAFDLAAHVAALPPFDAATARAVSSALRLRGEPEAAVAAALDLPTTGDGTPEA